MINHSNLSSKDNATIRHLQNQIQIEIKRAEVYSQAGQLSNARACLERAENCNDRIYCIETGEPDAGE